MTNRSFLIFVLGSFMTINILQAADYYWVGGTGNWSDISHWMTTSGGTVQHNVIPTANDRVFFDARSFTGPNQTVTVNNPTIFCKDLIWTGATGRPVFTGPTEFVLNIYGSLILVPDMVFNYHGDVFFRSFEGGKQIDLAGHKLLRNAIFSGDSPAEWTLLRGFQVDSLLYLEAGTFKSGGHPIICELLRIQSRSPLRVELDTSRVTITGVPYTRNNILEAVGDIHQSGLTLSAEKATLDFNSPDVYFRIRNTISAAINIGTVLFSSTIGKSVLQLDALNNPNVNIGKLAMRNDAELRGPGKFGELDLGPGKNFTFHSGMTYELQKLTALGVCSAPIQLFSSEPGRAVIFRASTGMIAGSFLSLRDIHGTGGAAFTASNSADLGNNLGWTINPKANSSLYWVGGSGMWNDPSNWALTSGGAGGACVPTAGDDVFFDQNAFSFPGAVVMINVDNAYCRSMNWTGATGSPILMGSSEKNMHIFGSLTLNPGMRLDFEGDFLFESNNPGNTISSSGKQFRKDVIFNGQGSWALADSLSVIQTIFLEKGSLSTNDQGMSCDRFLSESNTARSLVLGNSYIKIRPRPPGVNWTYWTLNADSLVFNAGSSTIEFFGHGDLRHRGIPQLLYHKIIFNTGSGLFSDVHKLNHIIDTLEMRESGYFSSTTKVNTWRISRGVIYTLFEGDTLIIDNLVAPEGCLAMIEFRSSRRYRRSFISHKVARTLDRVIVQDFQSIGPGTLSATQSVNLGNSEGWVLNQDAGRTLFWVGGSGSWHETEHWSLSSGGPGGECIPTPIDDVIFDEKSFLLPDQTVFVHPIVLLPDQSVFMYPIEAYCKNIVWRNLLHRVFFSVERLHVFGSMETSANTRFLYFNTLRFRSEESNKQIKIGAAGRINNVEIAGGGSFYLQDSLHALNLIHSDGTFHSNGKLVDIDYFNAITWGTKKTLIMGGSHWKVRGADKRAYEGTWNVDVPLTYQPDSSLVEFTSPIARILALHPIKFHNVLFSAVTQQSKIEATNNATGIFNRLEFRNNGVIIGAHTIDSLFFSPGKSYQLDFSKTQMVKEYWQMRGNNCLSIGLSSTLIGQKSKVIMNGGVVSADFVQMRDQLAEGTTNFFAGNNSTNIGNSNDGWLFEGPEEYVDDGILGRDVVLCKATTIELDGRTYIPGETYRWSTGARTPTISVNLPGTYWVELRYGDNCVLLDTINLLKADEFTVNLPADTVLCSGDTLRLEPGLDLVGLKYLWQDSSSKSSLLVRGPGKYKVTVELTGCPASDSLMVAYTPPPPINLGADLSLCQGQTTTLDATLTGATAYRWQDGSTSPTFVARTPGTYVVEVFEGRCSGRDSINIAYEPPLNLSVGKDTIICEGANVTLRPSTGTGGSITYRWHNGLVANTFLANMAGVYWVEATRNGCSERDSIVVSLKPLPRFELGADTSLCEGEELLISGKSLAGTTYLWNNGLRTDAITVKTSGLYQLSALLNGCTFQDSLRVSVTSLPLNRLGADRTICQGQTTTLDASVNGGVYLWQDGSVSPQLTVGTSGSYRVRISIGRCSVTDTAVLNVNPLPVFDLGRDTQLCVPAKLELRINTLADSYRWQDGSSQAVFTAGQSGLFRATAVKDGCSWADSLRIEVFQPQKPNLGLDTTICENTPFTLFADVSGKSLRWQDGSNGNSLQVKTPGQYILSVLEGPCAASDTVSIAFRRCSVFKAYVPNAFSPNGDGINDTFRPLMPSGTEVQEYIFRVFDRWGNQLFGTTESEDAWDGSFRGSTLPIGVYVYYVFIKYKYEFEEDTAKLAGEIMLTR